ncbi:hypothetical protein AL480_03750 [Stenotrophomonas maltophilia]|nr:hypothetical protein AL480_03750 [Stenotrophomonas maltophilia]MBH1417138.1 hypothetical protein [Stenotrophomonas maltophilia]HDS1569311.1 hypothetical protein [Stenotrophomonas maltophilia]HDS1591426.1 hypothetical protein [Stenotrophomonas maltophilia]
MSTLSVNLTARRELLGLNIPQVHAALTLRGVSVAESTVYGWFNGSRGVRKMEHLKALCEVLQTDLNSLTGDEVEVAEGPLPASIVRELSGLSEVQQQAVLATIKAMKTG